MWRYALVAAVAAAVAYLLTPGVRVLSIKIGALDVPKDRKVHHAPTPTLGGIAIAVAFLAGLGAAATIPSLRQAFRFTEVFGLIVGGMLMLAIGTVDDLRDLPAPVKLAGQVIAAGIVYQFGIQMDFFWVPGLGVLSLGPDLSALLTIVWFVGLINAVNLIDGLDGLAAGLSAIAAVAFVVYFFQLPSELQGPHPLAPLAAAALAGACIGFLRHNFDPARIFMGDAGAYLLGFVLAAATVSAVGRTTALPHAEGRLALPLVLTPVVFLALPITDVAFAILRRVFSGRPMFHPDKEHIHHRLMRLGHSKREAVLVMYGWAVLLAGGLVLAAVFPLGRFLLLFAVAGGSVALFTFAPRFRDVTSAEEPDLEIVSRPPAPAER